MKKNNKNTQLSAEISRRDFVNGALVGTGAALLTSVSPFIAMAQAKQKVAIHPWNGFSGVGDYARSNGNVASTMDAAHLIRDGLSIEMMDEVEDTGEEYDMVIIGGGFSGIGAAYEFNKTHGSDKKCLIIENHPVFGGEAKQNEFEVDGYKLYGPQGSNDFVMPDKNDQSLITEIYKKTGLPFEISYIKPDPDKTKIKAPYENYNGMFWDEVRFDVGYYMGKNAETPWVLNPRKNNLENVPWSESFKTELNATFEDNYKHNKGDELDQWLDSMSYKELLEDVLGLSAEITAYYDPIIAISMGGVGGDAYSAYSAKMLEMPGTEVHYKVDLDAELNLYSYPGGNAGIFRHIIKYLIPDSIEGTKEFEEILYNPINFDALDKPENQISIRLNSTAIDVSHAQDKSHVSVSYHEGGKVKRVKANAAVISIGGWIARNIVSDIPDDIYDAYTDFFHSPVLVVNVAVRNWRFLDKLGISSARWFEGFGNFFSMRTPMDTGDATMPYDPEKPAVLTYYVPFNNPGHSLAEQGTIGREEMFAKSYADYEKEIVDQMTDMFADYGFDAKRDIAGIVLNRWGHAYISPQPGFHFGKDGKEAPKEIVRKGFGNIQFGHSELTGYMSHTRALEEGARAARDVMKKL
ncbi:MAG: NAD(P)-binding protein [Emcibacteraceae bacterium]|nr:NAD(P)-binding protein [Emcibacteraceae bacterium]MDG1859957.1 NAD(P)-binding protein [Emcibacteraceae bacterium]